MTVELVVSDLDQLTQIATALGRVAATVAADLDNARDRLGSTTDVPGLAATLEQVGRAADGLRLHSQRSIDTAQMLGAIARRFEALEQDDSPRIAIERAAADTWHFLHGAFTPSAPTQKADSLNSQTVNQRSQLSRAQLRAALSRHDLDPRRRQLLTRLHQRLENDHTLHLLLFDPARSGRIVLAHGSLFSCDRVVVVVGGIGSSLDELHASSPDNTRANRLRRAMDDRTTTIEWMDDTAPGTGPTDWISIATDEHASAAATRLRRFVAWTAAQTPAPIAVVGHSYGSVVASLAASRGLSADVLLLVGSPGAGWGVRSVKDYRLRPGATVVAGRTSDDPIEAVAEAHGLGRDPISPSFGALVIEPGTGGHSAYFGAGTRTVGMIGTLLLTLTPGPPPATPTAERDPRPG